MHVHQELGNFSDSAEAWQRAIDCFPSDNLTNAESKQRDQYRGSLEVVHRRIADIEDVKKQKEGLHIFKEATIKGRRPWEKAELLLPQLSAAGGDSLASSVRAFHLDSGHFSFLVTFLTGFCHMRGSRRKPITRIPDCSRIDLSP